MDADNNQVITRETKEDLNKCKNILCSRYRGQFSPHWYTDLTQFLPESQQDFFCKYSKIILKFILKSKGTRIAKKEKILKNKDEVGGIRPLNFNIYTAAQWGTTKRTSIEWKRIQNYTHKNIPTEFQQRCKWNSMVEFQQIVLGQLAIHRQTNEPLPKYHN